MFAALYVRSGLHEVNYGGYLTLQYGTALSAVEALADDVIPGHDEGAERRIGVTARDPEGSVHVPLVVHGYLPSRCRRASSSWR